MPESFSRNSFHMKSLIIRRRTPETIQRQSLSFYLRSHVLSPGLGAERKRDEVSASLLEPTLPHYTHAPPPCSLQGYLARKKTPPPLDPTVGVCLGSCGSPRGGALSYERGNPVGFSRGTYRFAHHVWSAHAPFRRHCADTASLGVHICRETTISQDLYV